MDKTNDLRQLQQELKEIFLITENWWLKNVSNEKEKYLFTISWNSYGPIMSNKASWRQIRYNSYFFLLFSTVDSDDSLT